MIMIDTWTSHQWTMAAIAVVTLLFGSGLVWRFRKRRTGVESGGTTPETPAPVHPSMLRMQGKRVDGVLKVAVGDFVDIAWDGRDIRIRVHGIAKDKVTHAAGYTKEDETTVDIEMNVGGALLFGGEATLKAGVNRFRLPQRTFDQDEPYSMYLFHVGSDSFRFIRVFVEHVNPVAGVITLNFFGARQ
jgi:hypothetical protein